jgi:hypothetical protein
VFHSNLSHLHGAYYARRKKNFQRITTGPGRR